MAFVVTLCMCGNSNSQLLKSRVQSGFFTLPHGNNSLLLTLLCRLCRTQALEESLVHGDAEVEFLKLNSGIFPRRVYLKSGESLGNFFLGLCPCLASVWFHNVIHVGTPLVETVFFSLWKAALLARSS